MGIFQKASFEITILYYQIVYKHRTFPLVSACRPSIARQLQRVTSHNYVSHTLSLVLVASEDATFNFDDTLSAFRYQSASQRP